jgi:hypothetical protein
MNLKSRKNMNTTINTILLSFMLFFSSCQKSTNVLLPEAYKITRSISYNGLNVDVIIDKPALNEVDVLLVYHGTARYDSLIHDAAETTLSKFKSILDRQDMMIISVVYPEENLLMGDNVLHSQAALLWVQNKAEEELGISVKKVFLGGHSQGGYIVTRLNTMHQTNGVIANAPGPLNLVYRCQLEENGIIPNGNACSLLKITYGTTTDNPDAYMDRSLLSFTNGFKSDILFVQGLNDGNVQMYSWPTFKQQISNCSNCQNAEFIDIPNHGHGALFTSVFAKDQFNTFINSR